MVSKHTVISELQRIAASLDTRRLSRSTFQKHGTISTSVVEATFGSWNEAIKAAGLDPLPQGGLPRAEQRRLERLDAPPSGSSPDASDDDLLNELDWLSRALGRRPSGNQVDAKGKYSADRYKRRWGSVQRAYDALLRRGSEQ